MEGVPPFGLNPKTVDPARGALPPELLLEDIQLFDREGGVPTGAAGQGLQGPGGAKDQEGLRQVLRQLLAGLLQLLADEAAQGTLVLRAGWIAAGHRICQALRSPGDGGGRLEAPARMPGDFRGAPPNINQDHRIIRERYGMRDRLVDEPGLLLSGDDADGNTRSSGLGNEVAGIERIPQGGGAESDHGAAPLLRQEPLHTPERLQASLEGLRLNDAIPPQASSQPNHGLLPGQQDLVAGLVHLDQHHVDGVRTDIDGCDLHLEPRDEKSDWITGASPPSGQVARPIQAEVLSEGQGASG